MIIYDSHTLIFENISVDIVLCHRRIIAISDIAGDKTGVQKTAVTDGRLCCRFTCEKQQQIHQEKES